MVRNGQKGIKLERTYEPLTGQGGYLPFSGGWNGILAGV
ncbi:MAG: hypothetical protein D084_Lepto4C00168G0002 [Leptospirillum sp. Group IV 'UBA BS']|nr:MAG: hypothetical protein D084_Lepto4C00168G0002 [Leptospirillum sp. Group IV 'UBA BS']